MIVLPNTSRGCVKSPRDEGARKDRRSHLAQDACLFSARVIQTNFSFSKMTGFEFSHSLSLEPTRLATSAVRQVAAWRESQFPRGSVLGR